MSAAKRLLIVAFSIQPPGGGAGVGAWTLQAFRRDYDLTLLTWDAVDLNRVNRHFGTSLAAVDFEYVRVDRRVRRLDAVHGSLALAKFHLLMRAAKRIVHRYDLAISTSNEMDFDTPGIQYIHYPWAWLPRPLHDLRWRHRSKTVMSAYYAACRRLSGVTREGVQNNITLCNSAFIADKMRQLYEIEPGVLFPPAPGDFPPLPWSCRSSDFTIIGRISPEKNLQRCIRILERVRAHGQPVKLMIIGTPDDAGYLAVIERMVEARRSWITLRLNASRAELVNSVARVRYGIHGMDDEHYGMVVAELVQAGCIPFVPDSGGPVEIVGEVPVLRYADEQEAARKIVRVIESSALQTQLLTHLEERRKLCSTEAFCTGLRAAAEHFFDADHPVTAAGGHADR